MFPALLYSPVFSPPPSVIPLLCVQKRSELHVVGSFKGSFNLPLKSRARLTQLLILNVSFHVQTAPLMSNKLEALHKHCWLAQWAFTVLRNPINRCQKHSQELHDDDKRLILTYSSSANKIKSFVVHATPAYRNGPHVLMLFDDTDV